MQRRTQLRNNDLLLRACLCENEVGLSAWQEFRKTFDMDADGPQYMPFLPLLEENLAKLGFKEPLAGRFKGIRKQIWYRNQLCANRIAGLLAALETLDIRPICLADLAMSQLYYSSPGLRPIRCVEFFVEETDLSKITTHLCENEWMPSGVPFLGQYLTWANSDDLLIALRFHTGVAGLTMQECRERAVSFSLHDVVAKALSPFDLLLYLLAIRPSTGINRMLSLCDAAALLKNDSLGIEWQQAHTQPLRLAPRLTLCSSVKALFDIGVESVSPLLARSLADAHAAGRLIPGSLFNFCANIGSRFAFLNR